MSFKEFTANILSTRDYKDIPVNEKAIADIKGYIADINAGVGADKGFFLSVLENGREVFHSLEGIGGYAGVMIRSPHYIALGILKDDAETEFYSAFYMQSIVKKLYEMQLGSCWINIRSIPGEIKSKLLEGQAGNINYLLAFGTADEKAIKHNMPKMSVSNDSSSYRQDPYGIKVNDISASDKARHSLGEMVYLHQWGQKATYEELESRSMADIFFYVRNAPSYKNLQPCRLILKDGETELAVVNPMEEGSYTDAGIMMFTLQGLAKDLGIPGEWQFVNDDSVQREYRIAAKIKL